MGMNSEAYNQSIERWEKANATLVEAVDRPELMDILSQSQPETIEELNLQAYNRETVADQATRYFDACDNYFEALDEPLTAEQREEFIMNIPLEPNKLAEVSYYMENMTPEIARYQRALGEEGFGQEQKQKITEGIPRSRGNITEVAQHYVENAEMSVRPYNSMLGRPDHKDEVNAALSTLPPTPSVISAQSYQVEHDLGPNVVQEPEADLVEPTDDGYTQASPEAEVSAYDVVADGSMQSDTMLSNSFACADAHDGAQSLEVIRAMPIDQPDVSVENDIRFQV
ncbi:MAG: hypothetical protein COB36_07595 [Alphaproteobacteria bacterium]|nr:MAG: hypothetical protein COB36_07595 [Alphaproteobacteria bacterium]